MVGHDVRARRQDQAVALNCQICGDEARVAAPDFGRIHDFLMEHRQCPGSSPEEVADTV
jgi:hypothetical protein